MRRLVLFLLPLLFVFSSCGNIKNIRVTDYRLGEVSNIGLSGLRSEVLLTVDNPAADITVIDMSGKVKDRGNDLGVFMLKDDVTVAGRCTGEYSFPVELLLADSVSPLDLLGLMGSFDKDKITVDADIVLKTKCGFKKRIRLRDVTLAELISFLKSM